MRVHRRGKTELGFNLLFVGKMRFNALGMGSGAKVGPEAGILGNWLGLGLGLANGILPPLSPFRTTIPGFASCSMLSATKLLCSWFWSDWLYKIFYSTGLTQILLRENRVYFKDVS